MQILKSIAELEHYRSNVGAGFTPARLGFVPTMGALHKGHKQLIDQATKECQQVVVSIFVNPKQFGPKEDYAAYPRPLDKDLELCRTSGVSAVFCPMVEEIYPDGESVDTLVVPPEHLTKHLCGFFRPGHFTGVATIVLKLFNLVQPHRAYFGEKDFQQLMVVKQMVNDLNVPVEIVPVPTGREPDGLAYSSRNAYLTPQQRRQAPILYETLSLVADQLKQPQVSLSEALAAGVKKLSNISGLTLQYLEACNPTTLALLTQASCPLILLVAAKLGSVRLIDNLIVTNIGDTL